MGDQMVFKRYELKYMLTAEQKNYLQNEMQKYMKADSHGKSTILSLYLDTPDYLLIRRSMDHPMYKEKIRLRSYGVAQSDTECFIELKKKYDSVVYKRRADLKQEDLQKYIVGDFIPNDTQIMREIVYSMKRYSNIAPSILLSYEREAFYSKTDHDFRMTFDENILWRAKDLSLTSPIYGEPILKDGQVLLEVKTAGAIPLWLVAIFRELGIQKTSFSKYATAYRTMIQAQGSRPIVEPGLSCNYTNSIYGGNYKYA